MYFLASAKRSARLEKWPIIRPMVVPRRHCQRMVPRNHSLIAEAVVDSMTTRRPT